MEFFTLKRDSKKGFKKLAGINRDTAPAHINKLKQSIVKIGMIQAVIVADISFITGKPEKYIIDGQHKYEACLALGIDIPYTIIQGIENYPDLVQTIALLNSSSKSWNMVDYVVAWGSIYHDFKTLLVYANKYNMEIATVAGIMGDFNLINTAAIRSSIKTGTFRVVNEEKSGKLIEQLSDVIRILPKLERDVLRLFYGEYLALLDGLGTKYDHHVMVRYIQKQREVMSSLCQNREGVHLFLNQYKKYVTTDKSVAA